MKDLTPIVSHNLAELRKGRGLTQGQLAEKFNYTDKSISKWEHGEALPDLSTLQELADFYGVTLDYLTHVESDASLGEKGRQNPEALRVNRGILASLGVIFIWTVATCFFAGFQIYAGAAQWQNWMAFVWACPSSLFLLAVLNRFWGQRKAQIPLDLVAIFLLVGSIYLEVGLDLKDAAGNAIGWNYWFILAIGLPLGVADVIFETSRP
jgi:transcriptional regulator with XRE-family HTH domain